MGEALAPLFAAAVAVMIAAVFGEAAAVVALIRGERLQWIAWLGVCVNAVLIAPLLYLLTTAD